MKRAIDHDFELPAFDVWCFVMHLRIALRVPVVAIPVLALESDDCPSRRVSDSAVGVVCQLAQLRKSALKPEFSERRSGP
ncbi:MAG: hypothetical protein ACTHQM_23600, partial [Thermoanaerobaculia bacterium]